MCAGPGRRSHARPDVSDLARRCRGGRRGADRRLDRRVAAPAPRFADKRPNAMPVDVELVIAVDVSNSMDPEEQELQREGYVAALTSREFLHGAARRRARQGRDHLFRMGRPARPDHPDAVAGDRRPGVRRRGRARDRASAIPARAAHLDLWRAAIRQAAVRRVGLSRPAPGHRRVRRRRQQYGPAGHADARRGARRRHHHQRPADHDAAAVRLRHVGHGVRASRRLLRGLRDRRAGLVRDLRSASASSSRRRPAPSW